MVSSPHALAQVLKQEKTLCKCHYLFLLIQSLFLLCLKRLFAFPLGNHPCPSDWSGGPCLMPYSFLCEWPWVASQNILPLDKGKHITQIEWIKVDPEVWFIFSGIKSYSFIQESQAIQIMQAWSLLGPSSSATMRNTLLDKVTINKKIYINVK